MRGWSSADFLYIRLLLIYFIKMRVAVWFSLGFFFCERCGAVIHIPLFYGMNIEGIGCPIKQQASCGH